MLSEKFGVNVKYFMSVGEKWITFTITYNSDILCEFENNFYIFNTVGKKVAGTEVMKFYYLIVRMGMCEFTVLCWRYLLLPREPTFNKNAKRKAKGFFFIAR